MFRSRRDFAYDTRRNDEVLIVSPRGHLDTQATNSFEMEMRRVLDEGARRVVFDLASLDFISSSGVRIVLVTARVLQQHQGRFALCNLKPHVMDIFRLAGMDRIVRITESLDAAVASARV